MTDEKIFSREYALKPFITFDIASHFFKKIVARSNIIDPPHVGNDVLFK